MKYIYIISLALSSIFIYKSASAQETFEKYAFFIPGNAFQKNTELNDIESMRPRYGSDNQLYTDNDEDEYEDYDEYDDEDTGISNTVNSHNQGLPPITLPYVKKTPILEGNEPIISIVKEPNKKEAFQSAPARTTVSQKPQAVVSKPVQNTFSEPIRRAENSNPTTNADIKEKMKKYTLESSFDDLPDNNNSSANNTNSLEAFKKLSIPDMLATIPYPNPKLPKFKQCYATYGMDLRVLYHRGNFPENFNQEKSLSKANSLTRFEVK